MTASSSFLEKWKAQRAAQQRQERLAQRRAEHKAEIKAKIQSENLRRQIVEVARIERTEENERREQAHNLLEQLQVQKKQERRVSEQNAEALAKARAEALEKARAAAREKVAATRRHDRQKENASSEDRSTRHSGIEQVTSRGKDRNSRTQDRRVTGGQDRGPLRGWNDLDNAKATSQRKTLPDDRMSEKRKERSLQEQSELRRRRQRETHRKTQIDERRDEQAPTKRTRENFLQRLRGVFRQAGRSERLSQQRQRLRAETRAVEAKRASRELGQREMLRAEILQAQRLQKEQNAARQQRSEAMRRLEVLRRVPEPPRVASRQTARSERMRSTRETGPRELLSRRPSEGPSWLSTVAQRIVDQQGKTVYLRGVNAKGLDTVSSLRTMASELALDEANLSVLTGLWGINIVRLPFRAATILRGNEWLSAPELLIGLDDLVSSLSSSGAYTLLAMKAMGTDSMSELPDLDAFTGWQLLAARYQKEPGVLFEVYSAPSALPEGWIDAAHLLVGVIRREHPASLCCVGGSGEGTGLEGIPLRFETGEPVHNVVSTVRFGAPAAATPFDATLSALARTHPVAVTEWTHGGLDLGHTSEQAASLFGRCGLSWVACHWNAEPRLVDDASRHRFGETRFGMIVRRALAVSLQP